jgi:hypothetical protein
MLDFVETVAKPVPPLSAYATKMDVSLVLAKVRSPASSSASIATQTESVRLALTNNSLAGIIKRAGPTAPYLSDMRREPSPRFD